MGAFLAGLIGGMGKTVSEGLDHHQQQKEANAKEERQGFWKMIQDPTASPAMRNLAWGQLEKGYHPELKKGLKTIRPVFDTLQSQAAPQQGQDPSQQHQAQPPQASGQEQLSSPIAGSSPVSPEQKARGAWAGNPAAQSPVSQAQPTMVSGAEVVPQGGMASTGPNSQYWQGIDPKSKLDPNAQYLSFGRPAGAQGPGNLYRKTGAEVTSQFRPMTDGTTPASGQQFAARQLGGPQFDPKQPFTYEYEWQQGEARRQAQEAQQRGIETFKTEQQFQTDERIRAAKEENMQKQAMAEAVTEVARKKALEIMRGEGTPEEKHAQLAAMGINLPHPSAADTQKNIPGDKLPGQKDFLGNPIDPKGMYTRTPDGAFIPEGPPPKAPTTKAETDKQKFEGLISRLSGASELPVGAINDSVQMAHAISASKTLNKTEKADALAFLATNTTPGSTAHNQVIRVQGFAQTREYPVIDTQTNQVVMMDAASINNSKGRYAPAGLGAKVMNQQAVFQDLHYNIDTARKAISALDDMDAGTRAQLAFALRHTDPSSAVSTFLAGEAGTHLTDKQQEVVMALAQLSENALSLRSVAGMGQGAQDVRSAIQAVLPSGKSPSKGYALAQLDKFEAVVARLEKGVPKLGPGETPDGPTPGSNNLGKPKSTADKAKDLKQKFGLK